MNIVKKQHTYFVVIERSLCSIRLLPPLALSLLWVSAIYVLNPGLHITRHADSTWDDTLLAQLSETTIALAPIYLITHRRLPPVHIVNDRSFANYRFHLIAYDNNAFSRNAGANQNTSPKPAKDRSAMFRLILIAAGALLICIFHILRVRQITRAINLQLDERLVERTRLARELHDTLLQTIQGSKMVADDALDQSPDPIRMHQALERLSGWLGQAMQEGKAALNSLRTPTTQRNDLVEALTRAADECASNGSIQATFSVIGIAREIHPVVRDEIYRIGYEAIRNACIHSLGTRIAVELIYAHGLCMKISDNGVGIDMIVANNGSVGHIGLQGMRKRAQRIEATFTLVSSPITGTEITLAVPGNLAFSKTGTTSFKKIKALFK
ncbi:sensor histidine kinase [Acidicapsa ligni]|uniref:sensor histidine kinase n=1 Tax=Acidicapsa ligni TaxID=542300 RepID=UPI0021DFD674|nr:histidine kinase [Acidicapsa ligni]